jgi:hypothetical protein
MVFVAAFAAKTSASFNTADAEGAVPVDYPCKCEMLKCFRAKIDFVFAHKQTRTQIQTHTQTHTQLLSMYTCERFFFSGIVAKTIENPRLVCFSLPTIGAEEEEDALVCESFTVFASNCCNLSISLSRFFNVP